MSPTAAEELVTPPATSKQSFTLRQYKYKRNRLKGMSQKDAAVAAGYSESYAAHKAFKIERLVEGGIIAELNRAGATDRVLARELTTIATAVPAGPVTVKEKLHALETIAKLKKHLNDQPLPDPSEKQIMVVLEDRSSAIPVQSSAPSEIVIEQPEIILEPRNNGNGAHR